jgi:small subunit ribosomal protein S1
MARTNLAKNSKLDDLHNAFTTGESFEELFAQSIETEPKEGTLTKGRVVRIENDFVVIDAGLKSEGYVPKREFEIAKEADRLNVGDIVEVYIERLENREGKTVLSREKALREEAWERLEKIYEEGKNVNGTIFGRVKGGFTVDLQGVVAFLPGSQVDIRPIKDVGPLMNIEQPFQVLKMDRRQGNIVVSRRAIMEESRQEARDELLSQVSEGQVMEGIVKNITDYGAFIDLGSIDGLLHVTDISWSRINHPSEVLSLGQKIKVKIIKYNEETKRISLGMKQLETNPWQDIGAKFPIGSVLKGNVTNITDYGAFVELEPGIEGLVHVSEISWTKNNVHPRKLLSGGQEVKVKVLDIDPDKHRISLGIKQCEENPWQNFASKHNVGDVVEGEVKNLVDFGMFVGFEGDIDGLVHVSDVTWEGNAEEALKAHKPGDRIQAKILSYDPEKQRISLGIKQLAGDPAGELLSDLKKNATVTCVVTQVQEDGIEVSLKDGALTSFIKRADLSRDRVEQRPDRFAVNDRVDAKIVSVDKSGRKVTLSIKALEMDAHKKAIEEYGSTDSGASLGDILGAALDKSKAKKKDAE